MIHRRDAVTAMAAFLIANRAPRLAFALQPAKAKARAKEPGKRAGGLRVYDEILEGCLAEHHIVGASLAIAKGGRLILARGYGLADAEAERPVTPQTLFCIASVSKSITAVAALRLVDQGKVGLDARIVDVLSDIRPPGGKFADPRFPRITLRHLLFHGSGIPDRVAVVRSRMAIGEDVDGEGEGGAEVADAMVRNAMAGPLDFAPGSDHKYSNSGFMVARQVVERAAGQDYVKFVHEQVLRPMGITRALMEAASPVAGETARYVLGPKGRRPAVRNPVNWLFTPAEMVKFLTTVAGLRGEPFLSPATYRAMVALPPPPIKPNPNGKHVGLGWDAVVNTPHGDGFSKNGGKGGVSAWAEHRPDGVSWAFMLNTTRAGASPDGPRPDRQIIRRVNQALDAQAHWPAVDLFERVQTRAEDGLAVGPMVADRAWLSKEVRRSAPDLHESGPVAASSRTTVSRSASADLSSPMAWRKIWALSRLSKFSQSQETQGDRRVENQPTTASGRGPTLPARSASQGTGQASGEGEGKRPSLALRAGMSTTALRVTEFLPVA